MANDRRKSAVNLAALLAMLTAAPCFAEPPAAAGADPTAAPATAAAPLSLDPFAPKLTTVQGAAPLRQPALLAAEDPSAGSTASTRYGFLNLLDHRSSYGKFWFPEPLRADESDVDNELRFNYFHAEKKHQQADEASAEFEHAFGMLTLEIEGRYESGRSQEFNSGAGHFERMTEEGFTNLELGLRFPFFQYVSPDNFFDTTFVFGLEVAPPIRTNISKDTEIVPRVANLTRLGERFSLQTSAGVSTLIGQVDHGLSTLEYSAVFGYELPKEVFPLPLVLHATPIFELDGEYTFNQESAGHNELSGTAGFHFDFQSLPFFPAQPRLGIGYTFPIDDGARQSFRWGIVTSIIFEY